METAWVGPKLGGAGPQRITWVGQTAWTRLMESQIRHPPAGSVGAQLRKGTMASASTSVWDKAAPLAHTGAEQFSFSPYVSGDFKLLFPCWSSEGVSLSKSVHEPFKRNCLGLQKFLSSTASTPAGFYSQSLGTFYPVTGTLGGAWCVAGSTCNKIPLSVFISPAWTRPFRVFTTPTSLDVVSLLIL